MDSAASKILAAMGVTVLFSLIGEQVEGTSLTGKGKPDPGRVLLGGGAATAILVGFTELGDAGARFGQGLATIAVLAATLVYGGPVWQALSKKLGTKTAAPTSTSPTAPTGATAPTGPTSAKAG